MNMNMCLLFISVNRNTKNGQCSERHRTITRMLIAIAIKNVTMNESTKKSFLLVVF
jgi:hypothetical protein